MNIRKNLLFAALIGLTAAATAQDAPATAPASQPAAAEAQAPANGKIVATVDGAKITQAELDKEMKPMMARLAGLPPEQRAQYIPMVQDQAMDNLVTKKVLTNYAKANKLNVTDEDVKAEIAELHEHLGGEEKLTEVLTAQGFSRDDLDAMVREQVLFEKCFDNRKAELEQPSEEEVNAFFEQHADRLGQPEVVRASHILVKFDADADEATKAEKRKQIEKILEKVKAGEEFGELAKTYSDCPSAAQGGDLGEFQREQMVKPFSDAAFALKPGEKSGIVESEFGYHIISVQEHKEGKEATIENSREQIVDQLQAPKVGEWIEEMRSKADVQFMQEEDADAAPAVQTIELPKSDQ